jgi:hypothetical protein
MYFAFSNLSFDSIRLFRFIFHLIKVDLTRAGESKYFQIWSRPSVVSLGTEANHAHATSQSSRYMMQLCVGSKFAHSGRRSLCKEELNGHNCRDWVQNDDEKPAEREALYPQTPGHRLPYVGTYWGQTSDETRPPLQQCLVACHWIVVATNDIAPQFTAA